MELLKSKNDHRSVHNFNCIDHDDKVVMFFDKEFMKRSIDLGVKVVECSNCGRELKITDKFIEMFLETYNEE